MESVACEGLWDHIDTIPDEEIWNSVLLLKTQLIEYLPRPPQRAHPKEVKFDPRALTIGFAWRSAGYKRSSLLLEDSERLLKILSDPKRPAQIIFSGKAHPRDNIGKAYVIFLKTSN